MTSSPNLPAPHPHSFLIEARDVRKSFGQTPALRGASVSVSDGEILAIMGPSGSGKTTLLNAMSQMIDNGERIVTIEGLSPDGSHPVQRAWVAHQVPQCGYCQSGQIMAAAALLAKNRNPDDAQIDSYMTGIFRCGPDQRMRAAIHAAAQALKG